MTAARTAFERDVNRLVDDVLARQSEEVRGFLLRTSIVNDLDASLCDVLCGRNDSLEMHKDGVERGQRVLVVDDLLATGGTARATVDLVRQLGGEVQGLAFLIELTELEGRRQLEGEQVMAVLKY